MVTFFYNKARLDELRRGRGCAPGCLLATGAAIELCPTRTDEWPGSSTLDTTPSIGSLGPGWQPSSRQTIRARSTRRSPTSSTG